MKKVLFGLLFILAFAPAVVFAGPLADLEEWGKKQEIRSGGSIDGTLQAWGASYWVPISYGTHGWRNGKGMPYFDAMVGASYAKKHKPKGLLGVQAHPFNLGKWAFAKLPEKGKIAKDRFKTSTYPKLSIGPAFAISQRDAENMYRGRWKSLKGGELLQIVVTYKFKLPVK